MDLEQLIGRHFRLQQELGIAYSAVPWQTGRIDRLTNELAATEREIAAREASSLREGLPAQEKSITPKPHGSHSRAL
jgi:hypothetical protein